MIPVNKFRGDFYVSAYKKFGLVMQTLAVVQAVPDFCVLCNF